MAHDVCLVLIINDDAEYISSKFEFVFLNIKNMSLTKVEVHDRVKNDMMNMFFLTDILYIRNMNIWFIQIRDRILLLNDDLQEILYDLNGYNFDFEIVYVYDELDNKKFVLFEVKYDDKYYIMKLNLINNKCSSLYELEYYSPFLYSCSLNKLIIGNSYNQRGGFDIVDMEII